MTVIISLPTARHILNEYDYARQICHAKNYEYSVFVIVDILISDCCIDDTSIYSNTPV